MKATQFIAFKCTECGMISVLPNKTSDGMGCLECNGRIEPIGYAKIKHDSGYNKSTPPSTGSSVQSKASEITVSVDTTEIDQALAKAKELKELIISLRGTPVVNYPTVTYINQSIGSEGSGHTPRYY